MPTSIPKLPEYAVRDHAPVRGLDGDPALCLSSLHRIERQCLQALQFSHGSRSNLRGAMRRLGQRLRAFGAARDDGHRLIRMLVIHLSEGVNRPSLLGGPDPWNAVCEHMLRAFDDGFDAAGA